MSNQPFIRLGGRERPGLLQTWTGKKKGEMASRSGGAEDDEIRFGRRWWCNRSEDVVNWQRQDLREKETSTLSNMRKEFLVL